MLVDRAPRTYGESHRPHGPALPCGDIIVPHPSSVPSGRSRTMTDPDRPFPHRAWISKGVGSVILFGVALYNLVFQVESTAQMVGVAVAFVLAVLALTWAVIEHVRHRRKGTTPPGS